MKSFLFCSIAARAWINAPEVSPASIITVARDKADIVLFLSGKKKRLVLGVFFLQWRIGTWLKRRCLFAMKFWSSLFEAG